MIMDRKRILDWLYDHPRTHPQWLYDRLVDRWSPPGPSPEQLEAERVARERLAEQRRLNEAAALEAARPKDWRAQLQEQGPWVRITEQQRRQCVAARIPVHNGLPQLALPQGLHAGFYGRERDLVDAQAV